MGTVQRQIGKSTSTSAFFLAVLIGAIVMALVVTPFLGMLLVSNAPNPNLPVVENPPDPTKEPLKASTITPTLTQTQTPLPTVTKTPLPTPTVTPTVISVTAEGSEYLAQFAFSVLDQPGCAVENAEWITSSNGKVIDLLSPCERSELYKKYLRGRVRAFVDADGTYIGYTTVASNDKGIYELLQAIPAEELCIFLDGYVKYLPDEYTEDFLTQVLGDRSREGYCSPFEPSAD